MSIEWMPLMSFLVAASFTPGPNNLNVTALGMQGGYRRALPFIVGVYVGVSVLTAAAGFLRLAISDFFFRYLLIFKILGASYLIWMAIGMAFNTEGPKKVSVSGSFIKGLTLQIVNPKTLFFSMTIFTLFLDTIVSTSGILAFSFLLPLVTIAALSSWALAGTYLSKKLENPRVRRAFYVIMALLLVYTALSILFQEFV